MSKITLDQDYVTGGSPSAYLTPNFQLKEFTAASGWSKVHRELVAALQVLRNALGRSISIDSLAPANGLGTGLEGRFVWVSGADAPTIADAARKLIKEQWFAVVEIKDDRVYLEMPDPLRPPPVPAELALDRAILVTAAFETQGDPYQ